MCIECEPTWNLWRSTISTGNSDNHWCCSFYDWACVNDTHNANFQVGVNDSCTRCIIYGFTKLIEKSVNVMPASFTSNSVFPCCLCYWCLSVVLSKVKISLAVMWFQSWSSISLWLLCFGWEQKLFSCSRSSSLSLEGYPLPSLLLFPWYVGVCLCLVIITHVRFYVNIFLSFIYVGVPLLFPVIGLTTIATGNYYLISESLYVCYLY